MSDTAPEEATETTLFHPRWWRLLDGITLLFVLPSLLAGTARWWWIGDLCCHFRLPYAIGLAVLATAYAALRRGRWLAGVSVVLAVNVGLLWPLFASRATPTVTGEPLRLMTANVYVGNRQSQPVIDVIRDEQPDIVLLLEVNDRWMDAVDELASDYPYRFQVTRDEGFGALGPFGIALLSRLPLVDAESQRLGTAQIPVITAKVSHADRSWTLIGVHPYPPVTPGCAAARDSLLSDVAEMVQDADEPKIVFGDFNVTRWSPKFSSLLKVGGLSDSEVGFGYQPTWPDWLPWCVLPIDHLLTSPDLTVISRRVGPSIASDHRPLIVDVAVAQPGAVAKPDSRVAGSDQREGPDR